MTQRDLKLLELSRELLGKGQWEEGQRRLDQVSEEGQASLEFNMCRCAILDAAGRGKEVQNLTQRFGP